MKHLTTADVRRVTRTRRLRLVMATWTVALLGIAFTATLVASPAASAQIGSVVAVDADSLGVYPDPGVTIAIIDADGVSLWQLTHPGGTIDGLAPCSTWEWVAWKMNDLRKRTLDSGSVRLPCDDTTTTTAAETTTTAGETTTTTQAETTTTAAETTTTTVLETTTTTGLETTTTIAGTTTTQGQTTTTGNDTTTSTGGGSTTTVDTSTTTTVPPDTTTSTGDGSSQTTGTTTPDQISQTTIGRADELPYTGVPDWMRGVLVGALIGTIAGSALVVANVRKGDHEPR